MKFSSCSLMLIIITLLLVRFTDASPIAVQQHARDEKRGTPSSSSSPPPIRIRKGLPFKNNEIGIIGFQGSSSDNTPEILNKNS
ncbi:hypothetical protein MAM1_0004d00450 [Mucor ambiguus]|uniref:Secreted protein n=1 Tax=Mucor ambiguus TaxID=91626 RepID=A0A0C9LPT2_9FUNG|nr:hypothetical protein MAM1_0004d00450 [Mucor ambiguus]